MNPHSILTKEEKKQIRREIQKIESDAQTRIVIHVLRNHKGNLYELAVKEFFKHRLHHEKIKTGILILISLKARQFQILGDKDIHEKIGDEGWNELARGLSEAFQEHKFHEGLVFLLGGLGDPLRTHFGR